MRLTLLIGLLPFLVSAQSLSVGYTISTKSYFFLPSGTSTTGWHYSPYHGFSILGGVEKGIINISTGIIHTGLKSRGLWQTTTATGQPAGIIKGKVVNWQSSIPVIITAGTNIKAVRLSAGAYGSYGKEKAYYTDILSADGYIIDYGLTGGIKITPIFDKSKPSKYSVNLSYTHSIRWTGRYWYPRNRIRFLTLSVSMNKKKTDK